MRTAARTLPDHCCSGAMRRAHATAQCTFSVQPSARHRFCLFCYTCVPAAAYRACSVAPRRQCATAADVVGAAVGIGGARPHARRLFCSMRLTPARMQTSIAAGTPMCRRPPRLHRCCITFRWAFVRSRYPPHFATQRRVRLAMCGCGPIWSQARSTRRSARQARWRKLPGVETTPGNAMCAGGRIPSGVCRNRHIRRGRFSPRRATARRSLQWRTRLATGLWR